MKRAWMIAMVLAGCAMSHGIPSGSGMNDAASTADGGAPADPMSRRSTPCGPNTCYDDEICCDALCGLCAFPAACPEHINCGFDQLVCGGVVCNPDPHASWSGFCCPGCSGDVCAPEGLESRTDCPIPDCE